MTYIDTNIFVYATINNGEIGDKCRKKLSEIAKSNLDFYTSYLTWDEVVHTIWKKEGKNKAIAEGNLFLQLPNISFLVVNQTTITKAQNLIEIYNLKPRGAIHTATAIINGIKEIISDNSDFDKVKEIKRIKI